MFIFSRENRPDSNIREITQKLFYTTERVREALML